MENQKSFFDKLAQENNFDPLVPENWYNLPTSVVLSTKVCFNLIIIISLYLFLYFRQEKQ